MDLDSVSVHKHATNNPYIGSVHTMPKEFGIAALFVLGPPSTLIHHAFKKVLSKTLFKLEEYENAGSSFLREWKKKFKT